jgi:ribonuclease R
MPSKPRRQPSGPAQPDLPARILALLRRPGYQALDAAGISKALGLQGSTRRKLAPALEALENQGAVVRIRTDRFVIPSTADLVTGRVEFHRNGTAHVLGIEGAQDVFISGENAGIALHGDLVVVRLFSPREQRGNRREGRVLRIVERAVSRIVGTLKRSPRFFFVEPDDPRFAHDIYVESTPAARLGDKVVVRLDAWASPQVNPEGTIVEVLGPAGSPGVDMLAIIKKHDLPGHFPEAVIEAADRFSHTIDPREIARRVDCRDLPILTIDPDDAKDFDDAIHVVRTANGWSLQVHIADVSHYVQPGTPLDAEARRRGNSTYLVDRVIPMLPESLSNGLCSLKPGVERLTYAAFIDFDRSGKPTKSRFARAVIRSAARLTYRQAFAILSDRPPDDTPAWIPERLREAWALASLLRKKRFAAGSLELDSPEVKVRLDENGHATHFERIENDCSHQLIEEFMLAANEAVARTLKNKQIPCIYRIHEKPDGNRLAEFREIAATHGIRIGNPEKREEIQKALRQAKGRPEEQAIKIALLRRLMRARYSPDPIGHYGLAKTNYTHFTSPIRRYADLVVHRSLAAAFPPAGTAKSAAPHRGELTSVCEHISKTERISADAEFESVQLKKFEFFERQIVSRRPAEFEAVVTEVRSFGLMIDLPDAMLSGVVPASLLGDDFFQFDSVRMTFFGRRSKKRYGLGDRFPVIAARVDRARRQVDFAPVDK